MPILYYDVVRRPDLERELALTYTDLDELLRRADFVTLHVGLTAATYNLLSAERLALMKPSAFLINAARGGIVDQRALAEALKAGRIAGAAVDVTEREPIPADDLLLSAPNCIITPHRAAASIQTRIAQATMGARNLILAVTGQPVLSLVNPEVCEHAARRTQGVG
jgi:phosphoglycerate dehydrogenase-like enzyme